MIILEWKPETNTAKQPSKAHTEDAAYDLYADCPEKDIIIPPNQTKIIPTGVCIMPPEGWSCSIRGRSGMNSKGKFVILGLVDSYYTGPWGVVVYNATLNPITIAHHDKIAQFTVDRKYDSELHQVEHFDIPENTRGSSGFGSTDKKDK